MQDFADFLAKTVGDLGTVDSVNIDQVVFEIRKGSFEATVPAGGFDLKSYDAIYVRSLRTLGAYISQFAAYHHIPCINDYSRYYSGTKVAQTLVFLKADVDFIPTYYAVDNQLLATYMADKVGYPYILKADNGSQGRSNYLVHSEAEVTEALRNEPGVDFIAQEYCPNDRDYRLLIVGDSKLVFERRSTNGTHLNNTSMGGTAAVVEHTVLPPLVVSRAHELAQELGLTIAGFDVIPKLGTDEFYFLEVNSQPQLRTGMLLAEKQKLVHDLFASF